jgi:hypothetical protein
MALVVRMVLVEGLDDCHVGSSCDVVVFGKGAERSPALL